MSRRTYPKWLFAPHTFRRSSQSDPTDRTLTTRRSHISLFFSLSFLLLLFAHPPRTAQAQEHLSGSQSGVLSAGEYIVDQNIWVSSGDSWVISPGSILKFQENTSLVVSGRIEAYGANGDSIYFISYNDDASWEGIKLESNSAYNHLFNYCVISGSSNGGLTATGITSFSLSNSLIHNNSNNLPGGGIRSNCIASFIHSTTFTGNSNYAIYIHNLTEDVTYSNLSILSNTGGIYVNSNYASFDSCRISNNQGTLGTGIYNMHSKLFNRCIISNNSSEVQGSTIYSEYKLNLVNCTIANNNSPDGSIILHSGIINISNSVILNNNSNMTIASVDDELSYLSWLHYCSIYNNTGNFAHLNPISPYNMHFAIIDSTNLNNTPCDQYSNIFTDPVLAYEPEYYDLSESSPCINAGDPLSEPDADGSIADIGASSYYLTSVDDHSSLSPDNGDISIFPNPTNSFITLNSKSTIRSIKIYNTTGQLVMDHIPNNSINGIDISKLASGVYFVRVDMDKTHHMVRVTLLK